MKRSLKHAVRTVAAVLALAAALPLGAAATDYDSDPIYKTVRGQEYEIWSTLYQDTATSFRGATWVHTADNVTVPTSYMGVSSGLYSTGGAKYVEQGMVYNTSPASFQYRVTSSVRPTDGDIFCTGTVKLYNGTGYSTVSAPKTIVISTSRTATVNVDAVLDNLADLTLDADGNYPITAAGETYGSELLASRTGEAPDLILAVGENGAEGYIRADDLYPDVNTPAEAAQYMEDLAQYTEGYREIPVYNLAGNEIDTFRVLVTDNEATPEIQATIDRLSAMEETSSTRSIWLASVLQRSPDALDGLVNGGYPRNSRGETYGNEIMATVLGYDADLQAAIGTKGERGYIRTSDIIGYDFQVNTLEDAARYMEFMSTQPSAYLIPLYDKEGTVIGQFLYGGSGTLDQAEIARQLSK